MGSEDMARQAPNVERMGLARRGGEPGRVRHEDAQGGDERGDPRLDHERRDDPLHDRLLRRAASLPRARRRSAGGHRPRGAGADPRRGKSPARRGRRLRRRRLERDRALRGLRRRRGRPPDRRRGGRSGEPRHAAGPAFSTARAPRSSPTRTGRSPTRTRSRPGSTTPASAPNTRFSGTPAAPSTSRQPTRKRWPRSTFWPSARESSPRSSRHTRSRERSSSTPT